MKQRMLSKTSAVLLAGAATVGVAVAASAAIADSEDPVPAAGAVARADSYLRAAQGSLRSSGISVSGIELAATRNGVDYFALRGEKDHCILVASSVERAGAVNALGCAPNDSSRPLGVPVSAAGDRPVAYAFWTEGGSLSASTGDPGAPLQVAPAQPISVVDLEAPGQGFDVTWRPDSGEQVTIPVPSAAEMEQDARQRFDALLEP